MNYRNMTVQRSKNRSVAWYIYVHQFPNKNLHSIVEGWEGPDL